MAGLQITAQGFEGDNTPEGWRHGPAVALGLIPSMSAWSWQTVETTYAATRGLLCDAMPPERRANTSACETPLSEMDGMDVTDERLVREVTSTPKSSAIPVM